MSEEVVRYADASVGYHGAPVLRHIDISLRGGQRLVLVGPNGAGKSTLMKSMLGLLPVLDGTGEVRGRTGYVPQTDGLDLEFPVTAAQVVLMGRYRRIGWWRPTGRTDRRAARDALGRVGLGDRANHHFGSLSGGQRQRVLLARAVVAEPAVLVLDEPFNGVDAVSQEAIVTVLRELTAAGTALVLSTHDLGVARELADVVCLLNGRQWAIGDPASTLTVANLRKVYQSLGDERTVLIES